MSIAIETVDQDKLEEVFTKKPNLRKFAYEFCTAFNVKVSKVKNGDILRLVAPSGLSAGEIYTASSSRDRSETSYIFGNEWLIKKEKSSSNSSRHERDSNKISTLIRTLKKNNEYPSDDAITRAYSGEIMSAIVPVQDATRYGQPKINLDKDITKMLAEHYLGVDTVSIRQYASELKDAYSKYLVEMKTYNESADDFKRFCNGFKLIGMQYENYYNDDTAPVYLVGEASVDLENRKAVVQATLKSYPTIKDLPELAVDVMMINTYMQGQTNSRLYSPRNELCLGRTDRYISDLDISVGYCGNITWVAIPKTPKQ